MMLPSYIIDEVYSLLASVDVPKHKDSKPDSANDQEYIVINSLPITAGIYQHSYLNVNCHVKDIEPGIPDKLRLNELAKQVLVILEKVTKINGQQVSLLIDIESSELFREERFGEHYFNLRFKVTIVN